MKKLFTLLLPTLFILSSCTSEDTNAERTPEEASAEIRSIADLAQADITSLVESEGVNGALDLLDLIEGYDFNARKNEAEGVRDRIQLIAQYFVYGPANRVSEDELLVFEDIKGLYVWNSETETFDESVSEFFIVQFPTEGSSTNNAELKIAQLELVTIADDITNGEEEYQLPTLIDAYLKVDDEIVIDLDLTANWSNDGFPEMAEVTLFVDPFTFMMGFNDTFSLTSSLVTSVKLNDETIIGVDLDVEFETEAKEEPKIIEGFVQYYNMKISGRVDATLDDDSGNINDFIDLDLLLDDEKIGDIVFVDDLAYVQYADGSQELLEEILEPVIADIEELLEDFE